MAIEPFTPQDFRVFELPGFAERMAAIRARIRPKLDALGAALAPDVARLTGIEIHAHVARHARRTVNPPDDTWVAFGPDRRGYKKAPHFKIAVSRHCVRFLFELGPEFPAKAAWARAWRREAPRLARALGRGTELAWFRNEHDETPAAALGDLDAAAWARLGDELTRTRVGQLVLGRRVEAAEAARWGGTALGQAARATFAALRDCFRLGS
ncbi:MAG TPA: DUF1054 family protein [Methylomirabilota bacterium]|jgi:uncharacterized protein YktB (UPF0637 family)|nr:DUF1054 family protein [Methylomirabilota bacterium]